MKVLIRAIDRNKKTDKSFIRCVYTDSKGQHYILFENSWLKIIKLEDGTGITDGKYLGTGAFH